MRIKKWLHDKLGWGFVDKSPMSFVGGDGFQPTFGCRFCEYTLAQDSSGSWFHLSSKSAPSKDNSIDGGSDDQ